VLTLALGIGATTALFSVIDAALLRPLPYPHPEQLVGISVEVTRANGQVARLGPSQDDVNAWRDGEVLSHATIWRDIFSPMIVDGPEPERVAGRAISDDYLAMHGVVPALGRAFGPGDMRPGAEPVVLLGHAYWQRRFGGRPDVLGETLRIDSDIATVVGVLPPAFYAEVPIWRPFHTTGHQPDRRGTGSTVYGRLRPGLTIEQAQQRLLPAVVSDAPDPAGPGVSGVQVRSLLAGTVAGYRSTTRVLAYAVGAILLIACINVAGLALARGATRGPELGVRASMGAGRGRLVRQLLAESLVLSLAGGAAGVFLAWASLDVLVANLPLELPANSPPVLNVRVLGLALAAAVTTGLLFGLAPAVRLSRVNLADVLSHAGRRHGPAFSRRGGQALIAAEVALAIVLLAGAGLMLRSFARMVSVDLGFDPKRVVAMEAEPLDVDPPGLRQYYVTLIEALRGRPGIEAVGAVDYMPLVSGSTVAFFRVDGRDVGDGERTENIHMRQYLPGYFEALGLPLRSGRYPGRTEGAGGLPGALVSATAASLMFGEGPVLGRTFERSLGKGTAAYQVVGVLDDLRHWGPRSTASPEVYLPLSDTATLRGPLIVVIRSPLDAGSLAPMLREVATSLGPRAIVHSVRSGSDALLHNVRTPRQRTVLLGLLGGLGLVLTLVGIFGTTAYAVGRRTQEIGVRMALGARPRQVVIAVVRDAMWPALAGIVLGLAAATLATKVIASFLFNTEPNDPGTFAAAAMLMLAAATLAAWIPARRAARVDPVEALRVG
jgi:putative ABC transport system permease protein